MMAVPISLDTECQVETESQYFADTVPYENSNFMRIAFGNLAVRWQCDYYVIRTRIGYAFARHKITKSVLDGWCKQKEYLD